MSVENRPRSLSSPPAPQLSRTSGSGSLSGTTFSDGSSPLSSHTATQGKRNTSVLSRIGDAFRSFFSSVKTFFGDIAGKLKALGKSKAETGERTESRRDNAEKSPGPKLETSDSRTRTRERTESSTSPRPEREVRDRERPRTHSVDEGSGSPPLLDDDDDDAGLEERDSGAIRRPRARGMDESELRPGIVLAARTRAVEDPGLAQLSTGGDAPKLDGGKLIDFMGKHSLATSSPSFWATRQAKDNVATLGGALAFSILDKVKTAGELTAKDRADFMQALQLVPRDPSLPALDGITDDMLGALDEDGFADLLDKMASMLMGVYGGEDSAHPMPGAHYFDAASQDLAGDLHGANKIDMLRLIYSSAISDPGLGADLMKPETVKQALEAMT